MATRLLPYAAGLAVRGTTWLAGTVAADATAWKIGETVAVAAGTAIYVSYLMAGESTSPQTTGRLRAQISLVPDAKRDNPDASKFDDAVTGVDPTPKPTIPGTSNYPASSGTTPGTFPLINAAMSSGTTKSYNDSPSGNPRIFFKVSNTTVGSSQSNYLTTAGAPISSGSFTIGQLLWYKAFSTTTNPYDHIYELKIASATNNFRGLLTSDAAALNGCPAGYTSGSSGCTLTDAAQVMKPDMPCELVQVGGQFQLDMKNPSCTGANSGAFTVTPTSARINYTDGTSSQVQRNSDGGVTITDANPTTGTNTVTTGPYNPTKQGYPVTGTTFTPPGGTGTGIGSSCGSSSSVPCAVTVDTTGFSGKDAEIAVAQANALAKLDDRRSAFDALAGSETAGNHGISGDGLFSLSLPHTTCQPLTFSFLSASVPINICDDGPAGQFIVIIRWALGALLAWAAMWYLWRRFVTTVGGGGAK
ncbi:MAG: hypothetical protein ABL985_12045 [Casimicrobium sp.]